MPPRQVVYNGPQNPRIRHEPWCKSPHPHAIVECTCPASASLNYRTDPRSMSVDQYDMLYKEKPLPRHKLKAIRHKLHQLQPENRRYWPHDRKGKPYDPRKYGYPPNWLDDKYDREVVLGDFDTYHAEHAAPSAVSQPALPAPGAANPVPAPDQQPPVLDAYRVGANYWEVPVDAQQAERWHTDPSYNPPEYTPEQIERARQRAAAMGHNRANAPVPIDLGSSQSRRAVDGGTGVVPTRYAHLDSAAQQQAYPANGQPMTPHTQLKCRMPLIVDIGPGPTVPTVVECECEANHQGGPHMARIQGRRPTQVIYLTWVDE